MVSKKELLILLTDVEKEYEKCWDILVDFKENRENIDGNGFVNFQFILATNLFSLDNYYRKIAQEEKNTIGKKGQLSMEWFKNRMKTLAFYKKLIKESIKMGKELGDSFAWIFYNNAPDHLEKHYKHELMMHTPPGIGGLGELEFVKNIQFIENNFVLYHGITTFLRVGDISLIDLKTLDVSALGELKTKKNGPKQIKTIINLLGPKKINFKNIELKKSEKSDEDLSPEIKQKLQKQMKEMNTVFEKKESLGNKDVNDGYYIDELNEFVSDMKKNKFTFKKIGDGLLITGYKNDFRKIISRLIPETPKILYEKPEYLQKQAQTIVNGELEDNMIIIGELNPQFLIGSTPLFWWPVDIEFLRKLYFREIIIATIYNPAHFINKLRSLGFTVTQQKKYQCSVEKTVDGKNIEIEGFSYFVHFIQNHLLREDAVIDILSEFNRKIESKQYNTPTKIQLNFVHHLHKFKV